jgi:hypothetical protein
MEICLDKFPGRSKRNKILGVDLFRYLMIQRCKDIKLYEQFVALVRPLRICKRTYSPQCSYDPHMVDIYIVA